MGKVNYSFMWMMATMAGDTKVASEIIQAAVTDVVIRLTAVVNSLLDSPSKGMAEMIASKTHTQVLDLDELRTQTSGENGKNGK